MEFETTLGDDIPFIVRVTSWEPYRPAFISGPPEDCYPSEGGYGEWEIVGLDGEPMPEIEELLAKNPHVARVIEQEVFDFMEEQE